ncbi:ABC transporter permease subunit [Mesorhizobium tamadayense]|uniref:ABC transporter permease subunit n=2 Tax=Mesorhizobium tamadayense TaxID=425306 RepID=A0A3P3F5H8_9HYPH|nr:ABC transporter permease subunit [Mesorhizobium tamadayense]
MVAWTAVGLTSMPLFYFQHDLTWLTNTAVWLKGPIERGLNLVMDMFVANFSWAFGAISWLLSWPLTELQGMLQWLPWSVTLVAFTLVGFAAAGCRLAIFTAASLFYMVATGYWQESMNTLALVGVAAPLAAGVGFGMGVLGYRSGVARRVLIVCLDLMQTVPAFSYLVPLLLLFGFGPVVGLIASAIYACPPMVRNVMHGLASVPSALVESGEMSGATRWQSFWWVRVPAALPQIMVGVNQTIMATLSMVIIASVIGGFNDIGWEVLSTMRKAQFGQSLMSGMVIALMAMILDRISAGFASHVRSTVNTPTVSRSNALAASALLLLALFAASMLFPAMRQWPSEWRVYPAAQINDFLSYTVSRYGWVFAEIKQIVNFCILLPLKIGWLRLFDATGYTISPVNQAAYWVAVLCAMLLASFAWKGRGAVLVALVAAACFFGLTNIPWPVLFMVVGVAAWQAGGVGTAGFSLAGMSFILMTGLWGPAMLSLYLCAAAVALSFVVGGALGALAASNDRFSAFIRPVNDTLQTIPQFVYLIPVIFLFQVGDFSALIAIVAFSIVPMIRYTEHGIRSIDHEISEAAIGMGCSTLQKRFQIDLPIASPAIMLGLNQTIMYALSMLVIAALVGTRDLGQSVYIALTNADTGAALTTGFSIAIIGMVADRIIQAWAKKRQRQLGLQEIRSA